MNETMLAILGFANNHCASYYFHENLMKLPAMVFVTVGLADAVILCCDRNFSPAISDFISKGFQVQLPQPACSCFRRVFRNHDRCRDVR